MFKIIIDFLFKYKNVAVLVILFGLLGFVGIQEIQKRNLQTQIVRQELEIRERDNLITSLQTQLSLLEAVNNDYRTKVTALQQQLDNWTNIDLDSIASQRDTVEMFLRQSIEDSQNPNCKEEQNTEDGNIAKVTENQNKFYNALNKLFSDFNAGGLQHKEGATTK